MAQRYLTGFGNHFASEAVDGALPVGRNSPQQPALGLYAEQYSGTAFTAPREHNRRSWLYRIRPSVVTQAYQPYQRTALLTAPLDGELRPEPFRWDPLSMPGDDVDFVDGLVTIAAAGDAEAQTGAAAHIYRATRSMTARYVQFSDGELLIVPEHGALVLHTEMGRLDIAPGFLAVLPRGLKFRVELLDGSARGYVAENYGAPVALPHLGVIGSNGLANARDFETPVAAFEDLAGDFEIVNKYAGRLWVAPAAHSPLDVVAWHGNHAPYRYDLDRFNTIGTVSFDHPDPSIFTVLTSASETPGTANLDFVIFPPRWMVAEDTFRPPWFHRNVMSEFMGLVRGEYDAKPEGFVPGGFSLHNAMVPHGPDADAHRAATQADLSPQKLDATLAFMFETRLPWRVSQTAMKDPARQRDYASCWDGLRRHMPAQPL